MRKYLSSTFSSKILIVVAMQCAPLAALSQSDESLDTANLLAQASDPAVSAAASGSAQATTPADDAFATDQLEQLVAPIALYSDGLLMQILMASTYPLEIVEADRWVSSNSELEGDALNEALKEEDWDPSVKSLVTFPSVLKEMSDNLDWTQDLGDAFLGQESEVMDTIQIMRGKAYDEGNLETTEQQVVTQDAEKIIVIESPSPEIVYVPTYSPTVVYGPGWGYPSYYYPGWYYPRPGYGLVAFGVGIAVGSAIWGRPGWGWGRGSVNINVHNHNNFNRNTNINVGNNVNIGSGGNTKWQHDASHRKGVNYKNSEVAGKYGANKGSNRVTRDQARGHSSNRAASRGTGTQARDRSAASSRPSSANRSRDTNNARPSGTRNQSATNRNRSSGNSALSGSRHPSRDRMSSTRGASSRGTHSFGGSKGGARRGGGRRH